VPFEELPRAFNPPSGVIVNANARVVPDSYRHFITKDWVEPYRQRRAAAMLAAVQRHSVGSMIAMQEDNVSPDTADTLPLMLAIEPRNFRQAAAIDMLRAWNRRMLADRPEPLLYSAWLRELHRALYADELGEDLFREVSGQSVAFLVKALRENSPWCDDTRTREVETCADIIARSLDTALDQLIARYGTSMERWRWGDAHPAVHRHVLLDALPLVRNAASVRFPADGGPHTLNRAAYNPRDPFSAVHGATLRAIYDFEDLDNSRFAIPLGQSGNVLSPWYRNFVDGWRRFDYVRIAGFRFALINQGIGTINLAPPGK
jgi:penicillin amidase